jgi:hypothetical protein
MLLASSSARADWSLVAWTLGVGGVQSSPMVQGAPAVYAYTPKLTAPAFSIEAELPSQVIAIVLSSTYLHRQFNDGNSGTWTSTILEGAGQLRFWIGSVFALGFGGYFASAFGSLQPAGGGQSAAYQDYGINNTDWGGIGSATIAIPLGKVQLIFDGRATYSLINVATGNGVTFRYFDAMGFVGLRFGGKGGAR